MSTEQTLNVQHHYSQSGLTLYEKDLGTIVYSHLEEKGFLTILWSAVIMESDLENNSCSLNYINI